MHEQEPQTAEHDESDFRSRYLGSWASLAAFGRHFAADLGLPARPGSSPDLRPYVEIDGEALVMDMVRRHELQIIEEGRGVFHFFIGPGDATPQ
jgi:hypothetical protein